MNDVATKLLFFFSGMPLTECGCVDEMSPEHTIHTTNLALWLQKTNKTYLLLTTTN